jgi:hypothetical protein
MRFAGRKVLDLSALAEGMPGLTPACGTALAQSAAVCLEERKHERGVTFNLTGIDNDQFPIEWPQTDDQTRRCYNDLHEATEYGACGIAILLLYNLTAMVVIERSRKGTGFDYWLGDQEDEDGTLFSGKARLEVSGILSGSHAQTQSRLREKKKQVRPTNNLAPGYIVIVEFGTPTGYLENS